MTSPVQADTWTNHAGQPLEQDRDLFVESPSEIGEILSAQSTLRVGRQPRSVGVQVILMAVIGAVIFGLVQFLVNASNQNARDTAGIATLVATFAGLAAALLCWFLPGVSHTCTYVGRLGIARYRCRGDRSNIVGTDMLLFADCQALRVGQIRQYVNGIYTGTNYNFNWIKNDQSKFRLKGRYSSKKGTPKKQTHPFYFARAAELAWSNYQLSNLQLSLEQKGYIEFRINKNDVVRVGSRFLEFVHGGEVDRIDAGDIGKITLGGGVFKINRKDVRLLSRDGKHSFKYASMDNARLFLLALEKLVGYRFN